MRRFLGIILLSIMYYACLASAQWGPDVRLTYTDSDCFTTPSSGRSIVSDTAGHLHVTWVQTTRGGSGRESLWYKRWRGFWEAPVQLTDSTVYGGALSNSFSVATDIQGEVFVVWTDIRLRNYNYEIYCRTSTDGGTSWNPEERLTNAPGESESPSMVALGTTVHVVWIDYRNGPTDQVYYKKRVGGSWSQDTALTAQTDTLSYPTIACDSTGRVFVAWWKARNRKGELWFKRYNGMSWEPEVRLSQDTLLNGWSPYLPSMAIKGNGEIHLFWNSGNEEIYYKKSSDWGGTWGPDVRLTNDPAESWWPSGGFGPGNRVQVVWDDGRTNGMGDLFFKESTDGGQTWGPDTQLTTPDSFYKWCPALAVDPRGGLHIVWADERDTVFQVYYKSRAPLGIEEGPASFERLSFNLFQNAPNPLVSGSVISYTLPHEAQVVLQVYNPMGQLVRTLFKGKESGGYKQVAWDGKDDGGRRVPSGVYFYRLQAGAFSDTKKMVLIR